MNIITIILIIIVILLTTAMTVAFVKMKRMISQTRENAEKMNEEELETFIGENFSD